MAKLWRRACGWVGDGDRRSRMRRTSRGVSAAAPLVAEQHRPPRRHDVVGRRTSRAHPQPGPQRRAPPAPTAAPGAPWRPCPSTVTAARSRSSDAEVEPAQLARPAAPSRRAPRARRRRAGAASPARPSGSRPVEQLVEVAPVEHPRQAAVAAPGLQPDRRVGRQVPGAHEPAEVAPQRRRLAGDAAPGVLAGREVGQVAAQDRALHRRRLVDAGSAPPRRRSHARRTA